MKKYIISFFTISLLMLLGGCAETHDTTVSEETHDTTASVETHDGWLIDFEKAKAQAKSANKPMLLNFTGSDWCGWCVVLHEEVFSQKPFKDYAAKSLVLVEIDFPIDKPQSEAIKAQNEALTEKYDIPGYPTILLLSPEGELIDKTGYRKGGAQKYVEHLKGMLS